MPKPADFDALDTLERELGPTLRAAFGVDGPRPDFAERLSTELAALPARRAATRPTRLFRFGRPAWAALAALIVLGLVSTLALVAVRPQPASAAEVLSQVQAETLTSLSTSADGCAGSPVGLGNVGYAVARNGAGVNVTTAGGAVQAGPAVSPSELSDRLAQALGVSGDRVRQAMLDTMRAEMPTSLPPDPMDSIAQRLGLPRQQVCAAFFDGSSGIHGIIIQHGAAGSAKGATQVFQLSGSAPGPITTDPEGKPVVTGPDAASALDLNTATPQQLAPVARQLGVTPERLADAVHAVAAEPVPTPPAPPREEELINRFAENLGMSPDKVRSALTQVEGTNHFYFAVPVPKPNQP
jgi:hypothetical protein